MKIKEDADESPEIDNKTEPDKSKQTDVVDGDKPPKFKPNDYTDVDQARVFAEYSKEYIKFSAATDFMVYDSVCWRESVTKVQSKLHDFTFKQLADAKNNLKEAKIELVNTGADVLMKNIRSMTVEQRQAYDNYVDAKKYLDFATNRRNTAYIAAALKELRPIVEIDQKVFDSDWYLLNTPGGTIDLREGVSSLREHRSEDYITKCTAVDPGDKGKRIWKKALNVFFCGDDELIKYVQQIAGIIAVGHVYIEALIIAYGEGRNGKSTFWNTLARVLGDYSGHISADALTVGCRRNYKPELAEARGKRLLIAAELEEGVRLNTSVVKQISSTDELFAEKKYKAPFFFTPSHTVVLYTNHLPKVGANDPGIWRRLIVIPFNARIQGSGDIKNYSDYLFEEAGPAILS